MSKVQKLNVQQLFAGDEYMIPLYQRNYAWGEPEVEQLIQDIWDACRNDNSKPYYIGSLVVSKRKDGKFEVIDGQQRHTTLSILLAVLKNEFKQVLQINGAEKEITKTNLSFESRDVSSNTLRKMFDEGNSSLEEPAMQVAYETCRKKLTGKNAANNDHETINLEAFTTYLLEHVIILRTEVPEGTDLNHYFEIMNNRGEQLEKHEVLKARFMSSLKGDKERNAFAMIWDACADMNRCVVMGFDSEKRKQLFGGDLKSVSGRFDDLLNIIEQEQSGDQKEEISALLKNASVVESETENGSKGNYNEKFSSIINYPNFLLHVQRLLEGKSIVLDDKKLLEEFPKEPTEDQGKKFIEALLKYRFLLDTFVIRREHEEGKDGKWCIKRRKTYESSSSDSYVDTFKNNDSIMMIQSMFHVSYPTQNYKYWLNDVLKYLGNDKTDPFNGDDFLAHLEKLSDRIFFGRFAGGASKEYDEILADNSFKKVDSAKTYHKTYKDGIHNFVFNRLDYLLWKDRGHWFKGDTSKAKEFPFTFTFKSSVEHVSPQTHDESNKKENEWTSKALHSFGNLALVSPSFNSSASNKSYKEKREAFNAKKQYESLKLALIYTKETWNDEECKKHEEAMLKVLFGGKYNDTQ
jgi:hypothetical protein